MTTDSPKNNPEVHEPRPRLNTINTRTLLIGVAGLALLVVIGIGGAALLFAVFPSTSNPVEATPAAITLATQFPTGAPLLQPNPGGDLQNYKSTEQAMLNSYGWVDKNKGTVHIPIDQAMQLEVQRGMATAGPSGAAAGTPAPTQGTGGTGGNALAAQGEQIFNQLGCNGCHKDQPGIAPTLRGVYGSQVKLQGGQTITADEAYIKESILKPQAKIVDGYGPIMPDFSSRINDQQLAALIAYVESLGTQK